MRLITETRFALNERFLAVGPRLEIHGETLKNPGLLNSCAKATKGMQRCFRNGVYLQIWHENLAKNLNGQMWLSRGVKVV